MQTERHQPDYVLMIAVLMLTGIGIVTVYSASAVIELHSGTNANHYALRQLMAAGLGLIIFGICTYVPYHTWYKHAPKLLILSICLLLVVLMPGLGHSSHGSTRWLGSSSIHLQPSALAILVSIVYLAFLLTKRMTMLHDWRRTFRPAMIIIILFAMLIFAEPDMGTAVALFGTAVVILFASGIRLRPLFITLSLMFPIAYLFAHFASYRSSRIHAFLHPFQAQGTSGYQLIQGLTAISNGGWTGSGFDLSVMATGYLPESYTDFIFAVFTEQWGWVGDAGLLSIFAILVWRGFRIARFANDRFGSLLAIGLTSTIIIQAAINLGAVTWLLPVTGIPLPFISYGGTAIVINLVAMGILMSISRETHDEVVREDTIADVISVADYRASRKNADHRVVMEPVQPKKRPQNRQLRQDREAKTRVTGRTQSKRSSVSSWRNMDERQVKQPVAHMKHRDISLNWRESQNDSHSTKPSGRGRNGKTRKK